MPRRIEGDLREIKWIDETKEVRPIESSPSVLVANLPFRERVQNEAEPCPKCGTKRVRREDPRLSEQPRSLRTEGPSRKKSRTDARMEETTKEKAKRHRRVSRRKIKEKENEDRMNNYLINFKRVVAKYRPSKNRYAINRELDPQEMEKIAIGYSQIVGLLLIKPKVGLRTVKIISMLDTSLYPLVYIFFHRNFNWNLRNDGDDSIV